jgi:hypothetical protein
VPRTSFERQAHRSSRAALAAAKSAPRIVCEDDEHGGAAEVTSLQALSWNGQG